MYLRVCLCAVVVCFANSNLSLAIGDDPAVPAEPSISSTTTPSQTAAPEAKNEGFRGGRAQSNASTAANERTSNPLAFTEWEFEIAVKAVQHEPANKNHDKFDAKLKFFAVMPHASEKAQSWSGYGTMTSEVISRAPHSFQAPHRPVPQFGLQADSFWDHNGKMLQVILSPEDAVTYSLTTGEILGTTGILQYILPFSTGPGLKGSLKAFAIPESTAKGTVFQCRFDTSAEHTCWYDGTATLTVIGKRVSAYPPRDDQSKPVVTNSRPVSPDQQMPFKPTVIESKSP